MGSAFGISRNELAKMKKSTLRDYKLTKYGKKSKKFKF